MARRRRQKPAPEDTTTVRTVDIGGRTEASQQPLMPQDRVEQHMDTIESIQAQQKKWSEALTAAKEVIKAEGMNPKNIMDAIKRKKADPLQMRRDAEEVAHLDRIIGLPFQMTVHDVAFDSPEDQARAEAKAAAAAGRPPENRWAEGTKPCEVYRETYAIEQAKRAPGAQHMTEEEILAAVRKPAPPPPPPPPPEPQMDIEEVTGPIVGAIERDTPLGMVDPEEGSPETADVG